MRFYINNVIKKSFIVLQLQGQRLQGLATHALMRPDLAKPRPCRFDRPQRITKLGEPIFLNCGGILNNLNFLKVINPNYPNV